jgi:hypothetical protein
MVSGGNGEFNRMRTQCQAVIMPDYSREGGEGFCLQSADGAKQVPAGNAGAAMNRPARRLMGLDHSPLAAR